MRPRALTLAATAALPVLMLLVPAPAPADTTCRDHDNGNTTITRSCVVNSSRIGGLVKGAIYWDYKHGPLGQNGQVVLDDVRDRTADGKCTRVKVKYRDPSGTYGPETRTWKFCNGATGQVRAELNNGEASGPGGDGGGPFPVYDKGYYSVDHCSGIKAKTCIRVWRQNVAEAKDPT
jgi:hypothetical protein